MKFQKTKQLSFPKNMIDRIELIIDEKKDPQQAFRYYSALHELSISSGKREIYLLLMDNKNQLQEMINACQPEIPLRWLQGGIQIIDSLLKNIEDAGDNLNKLRPRLHK